MTSLKVEQYWGVDGINQRGVHFSAFNEQPVITNNWNSKSVTCIQIFSISISIWLVDE